jgi:hypothetical protein
MSLARSRVSAFSPAPPPELLPRGWAGADLGAAFLRLAPRWGFSFQGARVTNTPRHFVWEKGRYICEDLFWFSNHVLTFGKRCASSHSIPKSTSRVPGVLGAKVLAIFFEVCVMPLVKVVQRAGVFIRDGKTVFVGEPSVVEFGAANKQELEALLQEEREEARRERIRRARESQARIWSARGPRKKALPPGGDNP